MRTKNLILAGLFALVLPLSAAAGGLDEQLLGLVDAGAGYEAALSAAVDDAALDAAALEAAAASPDWRVRHQAAVIRGWREDPERYSELATMPVIKTRAGTVRLVGDFRADPGAAPVLLDRYLHGGEDAATRMALVEALFYTGGDWGQALAELIEQEPSRDVRVMMVAGLRHVEADWAVAALERALADEDPLLRAEAARAAGWHSGGGALAGALMDALADTDGATRAGAAWSLGVHEVRAALGPLDLLLDDSEAEVRLNALRAISRIDPEAAAALPQLPALSADPDGRVARLAAQLAR